MQILSHSFHHEKIVSGLICFTFIAFASSKAAPREGKLNFKYEITVLPDFQPSDMNELGEVAGIQYDVGGFSSSVVLWSNGRLKTMPKPSGTIYVIANGINESGVIAGSYTYMPEGRTTAFLQNRNGTIEEIEPESIGAVGVGAVDVNNRGDILLEALMDDGRFRSFIYKNRTITPVGGLAENVRVNPRKINDRGQVLAESLDGQQNYWGLIYSRAGVVPLISPFGGHQTLAYSMNSSGQATGLGYGPPDPITYNVVSKAYVYTSGVMKAIPGLGAGNSQGNGINFWGHVVGSYEDEDAVPTGFIYINGKSYKLQNQLRHAEGWKVFTGSVINNAGEILATAAVADGYWKTVILKPRFDKDSRGDGCDD